MQRLRFRFSKVGMLRFLSHLELLKVFDRALRRAGLPVAFSQGFNPHPRIFFASALAVGVASKAEFVDVELTGQVEPAGARIKLQQQLPEGISLLGVAEIDPGAPKMMAQVEQAAYSIEVGSSGELETGRMQEKLLELLQSESLMVERTGKAGTRLKDIRPGIITIDAEIREDKIDIEMRLGSGSKNNVRPEEVLKVLEKLLPIDARSAAITRTGLFFVDRGELIEPLSIDSK